MNTDKELISFLNDEAEYITDSFYNTYRTSVADKYNRAFGKALRLLEEQQAEIQKKDKVIDKMAKMINNHDIDEDICKQMGKKKDCNDYTDEKNCIDCIKEYFYKKVSDNK